MEIYLSFALFIAFSVFWAYIWVKTGNTVIIKRFIIHTIIFILLSFLSAWIVGQLVFLPVNESYSASNIGAVGILYLIFLVCFGTACIFAFGITIGNLINNNKK